MNRSLDLAVQLRFGETHLEAAKGKRPRFADPFEVYTSHTFLPLALVYTVKVHLLHSEQHASSWKLDVNTFALADTYPLLQSSAALWSEHQDRAYKTGAMT